MEASNSKTIGNEWSSPSRLYIESSGHKFLIREFLSPQNFALTKFRIFYLLMQAFSLDKFTKKIHSLINPTILFFNVLFWFCFGQLHAALLGFQFAQKPTRVFWRDIPYNTIRLKWYSTLNHLNTRIKLREYVYYSLIHVCNPVCHRWWANPLYLLYICEWARGYQTLVLCFLLFNRKSMVYELLM